MTQDLKTQVLDYVNQLREQYSIGPALAELPQGVPCDGLECVLARALNGADVSPGYIESPAFDELESYGEYPPLFVTEFINAFDDGNYPELIEA